MWACHLIGYHHPDLTSHPAQIADWYDSEDGLDLHVLDADAAALATAATVAEDVLRLQNDQLASLNDAWSGSGAEAAGEALERHGRASARAAAGLRTAAEVFAELRDSLWWAVDAKVTAASDIDHRGSPERADWSVAAHTVMTGAGDRSVASELVDQQVKPFVDSDIRMDWLTAMRTATDSVAASFDKAIDALSARSEMPFQVPGVETTPASLAVPTGWTQPASFAAVPPSAPEPAGTLPASVEPAAAAMSPAPIASPGFGTGAPDLGVSGLGGQIAETISGLLGWSGSIPSPAELDAGSDLGADEQGAPEHSAGEDGAAGEHPDETDPDETDPDATSEDAGGTIDDAKGAEASGTECCDEASEQELAALPDAEPEQVDAAEEPVPVPAPLPPPEPPEAAGDTPCEIAADQLPQVGQ